MKTRWFARWLGSSSKPCAARSFVFCTSGATVGEPVEDMHVVSAVVTEPCAHQNGPPAKIAAPTMIDEFATWNCTAKYAPAEKPETDDCVSSML